MITVEISCDDGNCPNEHHTHGVTVGQAIATAQHEGWHISRYYQACPDHAISKISEKVSNA